jgi:hypothetical protein
MRRGEKREAMPRAALHFGFVQVIGGTHAGKIGYYDDEDDNPRNAIVYLDVPVVGDYEVILKRFLRNTEVSTLTARRFKRRFPNLVKRLGIEI